MHVYARSKSGESFRYVMTRDSGMFGHVLDMFGHVCLVLNCCQGERLTCFFRSEPACQGEPLT